MRTRFGDTYDGMVTDGTVTSDDFASMLPFAPVVPHPVQTLPPMTTVGVQSPRWPWVLGGAVLLYLVTRDSR